MKMADQVLKDSFHMKKSVVVYVPSTSQASVNISKVQLKRRVNQVKKFLSKLFGGFTSTDSAGGYTGNSGELIEEKIIRVKSFMEEDKWTEINKGKLICQVKLWCKLWSQESMGVEVNGVLHYIDASSVSLCERANENPQLKFI